MIVYRHQQRGDEARALLSGLQQQLESLRRVERPSRDALVYALIDAGEFASAVADACAPERDGCHQLADACLDPVLALAAAADAAWCGAWDDIAAAVERATFAAARIQSSLLPQRLSHSVSEGFAYYALGPELHADTARAWAAPVQPLVVWCIGVRTIGLTLASTAAAALRSRGVIARVVSLRPRGHPFDRRPVVDSALEAKVTSVPQAWWLVLDEGPGISGSSMAGVARWLTGLGVPDGRIVLMPSHSPDLTKLGSEARTQWERHAVRPADFHDSWISTNRLAREWTADALEDVAGGRWRDIVRLETPAPAVHPAHERRKYRARRGEEATLLKFAGYGRYGRSLAQRAEQAADAGWAPMPRQARDGWIEYPWLDAAFGGPSLSGRELSQLAEYLAFITRTRTTGALSDVDLLMEMTLLNARELCGDTAVGVVSTLRRPTATPAVLPDARLRPHEWTRVNGRLLKTDGIEHGDDHFFPGPTDIAWDIAGAIEEWGLGPAEAEYFVERFMAASRDRELPQRLPFYRMAYLTYRASYTAFARDQLSGGAEAAQFTREHQRYRSRLENLIACVC